MIRSNISGTVLLTFFHPTLHDDPSLLELSEVLWACRARRHDIKNAFVAKSLFTLWTKLEESDALRDSDPNQRPSRTETTQIHEFRKFVQEIIKQFQIDNANVTKKKPISMRKDGQFIQDEFAQSNPNWPDIVNTSPCPACGHQTLVAHEKDSDIIEEIAVLRDEYTKQMHAFVQLAPSKQKMSKKPKTPVYPKQHMMCMCSVSMCKDYRTGKGCINCEQTVQCGQLLSFHKNGKSKCDVCQCACVAYFKRVEWSKLKAQEDVKKAEKAKASKAAMLKKAASKYII